MGRGTIPNEPTYVSGARLGLVDDITCCHIYSIVVHLSEDPMSHPRLQDEIKQSRPFQHPEAEAMLNLSRTQEVLRAPLEGLMKERGLSASSYNVLRILRGAADEGLPCREIGDRMVTRVPDVTRLLDRLEAADLVQRRRCTEDRRVVRTHITAEGLSLLSSLDEPLRTLQHQLLGHMSPQDLNTLSRLLEIARHREP